MNKETRFISLFKKFRTDNGFSEGYLTLLSLLILFSISVVYFYFFGKGLFFYQENNSLFIFSIDYLKSFTDKPGGLLVYAGSFLTQFFYNPLAGSCILSMCIILICLVINKIIKLLEAGTSFLMLFILLPSCAMMILQTFYDFHIYNILGFLLVLTWFLLSLEADKTAVRLIIISLYPVLFYVAGSYSFVYPGMYLTFSFLKLKGNLRYLMPALLITVTAITFIIFRDILFYQSAARLLRYPLLINKLSGLAILFSITAIFLILLPLLTAIAGKIAMNLKSYRAISLISILAIFSLTVFTLCTRYDSEADTVMKFEKMAYIRDWDGLVRSQEKAQSSNIVVQYYYNLALSEKGELCSRMFFGRQNSGSFSLTLSRDDEHAARAMYFYYTIGLTGEAHHLAYEQMVQHGYRPENIKMLIRTELIKGNFRIAERYINVLKRTMHYKKWAEKYEKMLNRIDLVNADPELGLKLRLLPHKDFFVVTEDFKNLELLLQENPDNKIAFEYKIAKLLLEKDLMELGSQIKKLKDIGYSHIPRHMEEAIVSLVNITKEFPDMGGFKISSDTDQRFIQYFSDLKSFGGNRKLIENGIKKADKNTFWYYLQFGLLKSNFLKSGPVDYSIY